MSNSVGASSVIYNVGLTVSLVSRTVLLVFMQLDIDTNSWPEFFRDFHSFGIIPCPFLLFGCMHRGFLEFLYPR
jgi:hypothetical protein